MTVLLIQAGKFGIVGLLNTSVALATIVLCQLFLGLSEVPANAIGYAVGLMLSFLLNRSWTFGSSEGLGAFSRFLVAFLIAYLVNVSVVVCLVRFTSVPSMLAQVAGVVPYTTVFFVLSRFFVFVGRPRRDKT